MSQCEAIVGNVRPPEKYPPIGHLVFNATFESGNLGRVDELTIDEYDLFIRPDTCNQAYRVWFYFSVENMHKDQRVVFNIVNFSKLRNLFDKSCAAPVYREVSYGNKAGWNRITVDNIYYYKSQAHSNRFILSFIHHFGKERKCEFAYSIPYTYTRLQEFLNQIDSKKLDYYWRSPLCNTVQKRRIDLLTISSPENLLHRQKIVFMTARVHPGETPSSHVLEGFIEFLLSEDSKARKLRSIFVFKIVPCLNPDGVCLGNYRTNSFLYGNLTATSPRRCKRQLYIPYILAELTDDYSLHYTNFNTDIDKAGTNRRTMGELLDNSCLCYTFEVSFFSYRRKDSENEKPIPYFEASYKLLGENLAVSILKYTEVLNDESMIKISRAFETFLPRKIVKNFRLKQLQQQNINKTRSSSLHAK